MRNRAIGVGLILLSLASIVHATTYTSPDGKLSFTLPADGSFVEVKNPGPPATAMWEAADGARILYLSQPAPQDVSLEKSGLEQGSLSGLPNSTLVSSTQTTLSGVPVFTIEVTSGNKVYVQQSVVSFGGLIHKVMAAGTHEISTDPRFSGVFQSLAIQPPPTLISGHDLSVTIGEIGIVVLIVAGVIVMIRRSQRSTPKPPPLP